MNLKPEEVSYVWKNYHHLLPDGAFLVAKTLALIHRGRTQDIDSIPAAKLLKARCPEMYRQYFVDADPISPDEFSNLMAADAVDMHGSDIHFERCPKCGALAKTPVAEQCLDCKAEWRGENPRRTQWELKFNRK